MKNIQFFIKIFFITLFIFSCNSDDGNNLASETTLNEIALNSPNQGTWVERQAIKSRNGQSSGYGVFLNPSSKKLFIFLDGGGACFNGFTCFLNPQSFTKADFEERLLTENSLLIKRDSEINQFKDWNFVFVPYSTGDVHSGNNTSLIDVPNGGPKNQNMNGYKNLTLIFNDIKKYFDSAGGIDEIVFAGSSAGGFGVLTNTNQMATILGNNIKTTIIVDAGQLMIDQTLLTPCLESSWNNLWSINSLFTSDLNFYITKTNYTNDIQKVYEGLSKKFPAFNFGFLSHYEDKTNRLFYSFGQEDCKYPPSFLQTGSQKITPKVTGSQFKAGLIDIKTNYLDDFSNWKVFYSNGEEHTFLQDAELDQSVSGTTLNEWIAELRAGTATDLTD